MPRTDDNANRRTPQPRHRYSAAEEKKSPRTAVIAVALLLAVIGVAVGFGVYFSGRQTPDETPTVTVSDPELGTLELQPPEDASVNSYQVKNLTLGDDGYYTYTVDGVKVSEMGVDLSEFQGEVDFEAVKASGIDFVMLRIGGRTYGSGSLYDDGAFDGYYDSAKAAGLKVGAYFFSQAVSREEAVEEAEYALRLLGGRTLEYPIAIDWESIDDDEARTDGIGSDALTAVAAGFCDTVEAAGFRSAVYASTSLILQSYDFEIMKNYAFWLADYREMPEQDAMYYRFSIWQYSDAGTVPGIEGAVDLNLCLDASQV